MSLSHQVVLTYPYCVCFPAAFKPSHIFPKLTGVANLIVHIIDSFFYICYDFADTTKILSLIKLILTFLSINKTSYQFST